MFDFGIEGGSCKMNIKEDDWLRTVIKNDQSSLKFIANYVVNIVQDGVGNGDGGFEFETNSGLVGEKEVGD